MKTNLMGMRSMVWMLTRHRNHQQLGHKHRICDQKQHALVLQRQGRSDLDTGLHTAHTPQHS